MASRSASTLSFTVLLISAVGLLGPRPAQVRAEEQSVPPTLAELLQQAADLKAQSQWDRALEALAQAVTRAEEDRPSAALAQVRLGQYRLEMALLPQAEEELLKVAQQFPDQSEAINWARLFLIDTYRFQTKPDQAEAAGQALLSDASALPIQQAWCRVKLGSLLSELQRLDDAVAVLEGLDFITLPQADFGPLVAGQFHRAEILMKRGAGVEAAPLLHQVISMAAGDTHAPTRNWARVRLAEVLTHQSRFDEAIQACDAVLTDHAAGRADDRQAIWALVWKSRSQMLSNQVASMAEAPAAARMAVALAVESSHPDLGYESHCLLGEVYSRLSSEADRLVKAGGSAYVSSPVAQLVEEARRAQNYVHEGEWGPLLVEAMDHYGTAMTLARDSRLGQDREAAARLQYATRMRHLGMGSKAIATLRIGIADPARLTNAEGPLAQAIGSLMDREQAEAWHVYLIDPQRHADPTASIVAAEFGTPAPAASGQPTTDQFGRFYWLGRLYLEQSRFAGAIEKFQMAEGAATTAGQRAEAKLGQARAYRGQAHALRLNGNRDHARLSMMHGYQVAGSAVPDWLEVAMTGSEGDAHYATEKAVFGYGIFQRREEALQTAEEFLTRLILAQAEPSKVAFAQYMKLQALAWNSRFEEAIDLAFQIDSEHADSPRAVVERIRVAALLRASGYYARIGQAEAGHNLLDTIQARHPTGEFDESLHSFRAVIQRYAAGKGD